jgi:hypothetical protein
MGTMSTTGGSVGVCLVGLPDEINTMPAKKEQFKKKTFVLE